MESLQLQLAATNGITIDDSQLNTEIKELAENDDEDEPSSDHQWYVIPRPAIWRPAPH
jgi:hypothetical protein